MVITVCWLIIIETFIKSGSHLQLHNEVLGEGLWSCHRGTWGGRIQRWICGKCPLRSDTLVFINLWPICDFYSLHLYSAHFNLWSMIQLFTITVGRCGADHSRPYTEGHQAKLFSLLGRNWRSMWTGGHLRTFQHEDSWWWVIIKCLDVFSLNLLSFITCYSNCHFCVLQTCRGCKDHNWLCGSPGLWKIRQSSRGKECPHSLPCWCFQRRSWCSGQSQACCGRWCDHAVECEEHRFQHHSCHCIGHLISLHWDILIVIKIH